MPDNENTPKPEAPPQEHGENQAEENCPEPKTITMVERGSAEPGERETKFSETIGFNPEPNTLAPANAAPVPPVAPVAPEPPATAPSPSESAPAQPTQATSETPVSTNASAQATDSTPASTPE